MDRTLPQPQVPRPPRWIPQFLLSPGLRLFCFRIVIISAALLAILSIVEIPHYSTFRREDVLILVLVFATAVHHIGTAFGPRLFPLPVWIDISLMIAETACYLLLVGNLASLPLSGEGGIGLEWMERAALLEVVAACVLAPALLALLILKILAILNARGTGPLRKRQDLAPGTRTGPWWKYPAHAIFGRKLWEVRIPGESRGLSILRGLLASASIVALVAFGVYQAIMAPVSEMGKIPYRHCRAASLSPNMGKELRRITWKVLLAWEPHPDATANLADAVTATARWNQTVSGQAGLPCRVDRDSLLTHTQYDIAVIYCPEPSRELPPDSVGWRESFPNFDVSVSFIRLLGSMETGSAHSRDFDSVRVYVGLTDDVNVIFHNTDPISLFPGTNMLSVVRPVFRERLRPATLGTLGFESQETFMTAIIEQTIPNPFMGLASDRNTSTLGLTLQTITNEWSFLQDYRSKSVLIGLSSIGGLGSLLSTLLIMLLGTSLMTAIIRTKPTSPFGFLHNVSSFQKDMVDECDRQYPALRKDVQELEEKPGVVAYLFNTLIDIEALGYEERKAASSGPIEEPAPPAETGRIHDEESIPRITEVRAL